MDYAPAADDARAFYRRMRGSNRMYELAAIMLLRNMAVKSDADFDT